MDTEDFPFPFPPYQIQRDFMDSLYKCLDEGNLGIFESPTGTGKTMSIICGALKWLRDHESKNEDNLREKIKEFNDKLTEIERESTGDWIDDHSKQMIVNREKRIVQEKLEVIERRVKRKELMRQIVESKIGSKNKRRIFNSKKKSTHEGSVENLLQGNEKDGKGDDDDDDLLLEDFSAESDDSDEEQKYDKQKRYTQFFLCSRTHSQLSQFIGELKKSPYSEKVSLVPIGSRLNYCVNKAVKKLGNIDLINERCLELQRSKKTTSKKEKDLKRSKTTNKCCPHNPGDQTLLIAQIITKIHDIEEIVETAEEIETCAYYASRKSLQDGQVIVLPYNSILHKDTRMSLGIDLKNNVIIIDEAHNLLEAIERMHSTTITGRNILHCYSQLIQYQKRFENLFSAKNILYLNQLSFCLKKFMKMLGGTTKSLATDRMGEAQESRVYTLQNFETTAEIDSVNMFELIKFIQASKLVHKLQGYLDKHSADLKLQPTPLLTEKKQGVSAFLNLLNNKETRHESSEKMVGANESVGDENVLKSPLMRIVGFLESLKSSCADGRIFVIPGPTVGQGTIKFLLMNPAAHFHDIVKEARSVILAGGTMEPISEFRDQLFIEAGAPPERIITFSCDHVVAKENILTRILTKGPNNIPFEFNYQSRDNKSLLNEVGRTLINLTNIVPGGIVVFLPSYKYEETLYKHLDATGMITKITQKKQVFREPKSSSMINVVLGNFSESIKHPKGSRTGSLLFSVVGGKLSEGLNFSDDLGRCIIVVGMPYPNIKSPELQEKMKYLNENVRAGAGTEYYENSCMKAVNQCIGRAVRHINDYASVILMDKRYSNKCKALPGWIQRTLKTNSEFSMTIGDIAKFFAVKKKNST